MGEVDRHLGQCSHVHPGLEGNPHRGYLVQSRLDCQGRYGCGVPPYAFAYQVEQPEDHLKRHLSRELQVRELWILWQPRGDQPSGFSTFLANIEDCTKALNWKGKEKDTGMEAWGEDLFMQRCMDLHGVDKVGVWDLTTDSMCKALRPAGQKKNEKWRPNCALTQTAAMHPFMKPYDYFECLKATQ